MARGQLAQFMSKAARAIVTKSKKKFYGYCDNCQCYCPSCPNPGRCANKISQL